MWNPSRKRIGSNHSAIVHRPLDELFDGPKYWMKGSCIGWSSKGIFRESASAAAELIPVTEVGQPLSGIGFTCEGGGPDDNVRDIRLVRKALLLSSEKTQRTSLGSHGSRPQRMKQALLLCCRVPC